MGSVTFKFHGRFLFAQSREQGGRPRTVSVIAPRFDPARFGHHQSLMTIRHSDLKFRLKDAKDQELLTTLEPLLRVTDPAVHHGRPDAYDPQLVIWDLSGRRVGFQDRGAVSLADNESATVLKLEELEAVQGRPDVKLDATALQPSKDGKTQTVVDITAGAGVATASTHTEVQFASEANIMAGRPTLVRGLASKDLLTRVPAEVVEFTVPIETRSPSDGRPFLTLRFTDSETGDVGLVSVVDGAVVTFSNACAKIAAPPDYDLEFSRYYDLLITSRKMDGLIPCDLTGLAESVPCYLSSTVWFELP